GLAAPPVLPRYALAIERMSIRPEPSPPAAPLAWPGIVAAPGAGAGAGLLLASCARVLSENSTEFSLRSPRSFAACARCWAAGAAAAAADGLLRNRSAPSSSPRRGLAEAAANRSAGSLRTVPASSPVVLPNIAPIASAPELTPPPRALGDAAVVVCA